MSHNNFFYYCPLKILSRIRDFENFFFELMRIREMSLTLQTITLFLMLRKQQISLFLINSLILRQPSLILKFLIKTGLVLHKSFDIMQDIVVQRTVIIILVLLPLQGVIYLLQFTTGRCPGLVAFAPSGRYLVIAYDHYLCIYANFRGKMRLFQKKIVLLQT